MPGRGLGGLARAATYLKAKLHHQVMVCPLADLRRDSSPLGGGRQEVAAGRTGPGVPLGLGLRLPTAKKKAATTIRQTEAIQLTQRLRLRGSASTCVVGTIHK